MVNWLMSTSLGLVFLWPAVVLSPMVCQAVETRMVNYRLQDNVPTETVVGNVGQDAGLFQGPSSAVGSSMIFQLYSPLFWIHAQDGILRTRSAIDRDVLCPGRTDCTREISVQVRQNSGGTSVSFVRVVVAFEDDNDNWPQFGQTEKEVRVTLSEGSSPGTRLLLPRATDPDSPRYGVQRYAFENSVPGDVFSLEQTNDTGSVDVYLVLRSRLDRESVDQYRVHLVAFDGGQPSKSGVALVVIEVKDVNDNIPVFDRETYEVLVSENIQPGTVIVRVKATDLDSGLNGQIVYELDPTSEKDPPFRIDGSTGEVIVQDRLDYETQSVHTLIVLARDGGGPDAIPGQVRVVVRLSNHNDNPPDVRIQIPDGGEDLRVSELSSPGDFVSLVTVTDGDGEETAIVCSLTNDNFRLEPLFRDEYKIVLATQVDREAHAQLSLAVTCQDDGLPVLTGSRNVTVIIEDGNDNRPIFLQDSYTIEVSEDHPIGRPLLSVSAIDRDDGLNAEVLYAVERGDGFSVDARTGAIFATRPLDREKQEVVSLVLTATDRGNPPLASSVSVSLLIGDIDDEVPKFSQGSYTFTVLEDQPPKTIIGQVQAIDADLPPFNTVRFFLPPEATKSFRVDSEDGVLYTSTQLDRELTDMEQFQLVACSSGSVPDDLTTANCSSVAVTVIVLDINDNDPSIVYPFPSEILFIGNRFQIGDPVARIRASDLDSGDNGRLHFHLINNQTTDDCFFRVDENSGEILVERDLSVISHETFTLKVMVSDLGQPSRSTNAVINLSVNETLSTVTTDERRSVTMMMSGKNLVIVIVIASASGLVVVSLVVAIACLVHGLSAKKALRRQRPPRSYLMRSDPREPVSCMSTLQLSPDEGGTNPLRGNPHAVYYDRSLDHATIGHRNAFKWCADDETEEEDVEGDVLGMGWKVSRHQERKRRLSLTAPADASDSGRGSSEEVMARNQQQEVKLFKCHMPFEQPFVDPKYPDRIGCNQMSHSLQHKSTEPQLQSIDAKTENKTFNPRQHTTTTTSDQPNETSNGLHRPKIGSVHFIPPPCIPLQWNTKEDGSSRAIQKSRTDEEERCFRSHPELLVDCNAFSSDNCGSFV